MSGRGRRPRDTLGSRSGAKQQKTLTRGFGIVRNLTPASQQEIFEILNGAKIGNNDLRRKPPLHVTVIGFVGMSRREQAMLQAGFNVARLEERLEDGVAEEAPRTPIVTEIASICTIGNVLYAPLEDDRLLNEQTHLAGQVALHNISPTRINRQIVQPHVTVGFGNRAPIAELQEEVEVALSGVHVALERWRVYPDRYG